MKTTLWCFCLLLSPTLFSQNIQVDIRTNERRQVIDGFGAHQGNNETNAAWWQQLYYDDLGASIYRVDLTPRFVAPYSNLSYYSPWFMGSATNSVFNLEDPDNPNGPENNRVRTYTGPNDYSRTFGGQQAPIAVMGPDIDENVQYFTYPNDGAIQAGLARKEQLGDFKLTGSLWSPAPWVKIASGNTYSQNWWPGPVAGTPWPFVWGGNFAGGRLDVSGTPLAVFDDSALGGSGPTSALTQFARGTAAYIRGYQQHFGVRFYAISIQNELNFEQFYNSATYPLSSQYIAALKAVRAEFDKYDDLKNIRLMGPEDLLGGDAYGLWEYGGPVHKNLQYLRNIALDPAAAAALDFFCIHGYDSDGASSAGANPTAWNRWVNGWQASPAPGIPANVLGFSAFGKKSWMTETSGEKAAWLFPATGFPSNGGWSIALKIHQALTAGQESAWLYWTFTESDNSGGVTDYALSNQLAGPNAPKYVAAKHFFKYIRPGAFRVNATVSGSGELLASAYVHDAAGSMTIVLVNSAATPQTAALNFSGADTQPLSFSSYTSSNGNYWQQGAVPLNGNTATVNIPAFGVVTLYGTGYTSAAGEPAGADFTLYPNAPNPFAGSTIIRYRLERHTAVRLSVFDMNGRLISTLVNASQSAGEYQVAFDGKGLPSGIYEYVFEAGGKRASGKMELGR